MIDSPYLVGMKEVPLRRSVPIGHPKPGWRNTAPTIGRAGYRTLIEAFEASDDVVAEVVFDYAAYFVKNVFAGLTTERIPSHLHIEVLTRGDRVFLRKRGIPGVSLLEARLGRSVLRVESLDADALRLAAELDGAPTDGTRSIVGRAIATVRGNLAAEQRKQIRIREVIEGLTRGEPQAY